MTTEFDLLVVGDCNPDVLVLGDDVTPAFGQQERLVSRISLLVGGSGSITAVAAARLGLRVALVAAIGTDAAGEFMTSQLAGAGVDVSALVLRPGLPTPMTVVLSRGTDRAILTAPGAMPTLATADVPADLLAAARHLHVSSYFLVEQSLGPGLAALLATARSKGASTSLDTNWDPAGRWGGTQLRAVLAHTDVLLPNEAEALHISGCATLGAAVSVLTGYGPRVALKLGPAGALCADRTRTWRVLPPAELDHPVVDATGAGDCFNAGLLAGLLRDFEMPAAARLGCAVGTASTRAAGGTGAAVNLAAALALAESFTIKPGAVTDESDSSYR
jgi:sugar/nucleoside kinase (ribokinase family)